MRYLGLTIALLVLVIGGSAWALHAKSSKPSAAPAPTSVGHTSQADSGGAGFSAATAAQQVGSDLRLVATAEEAYLTDYRRYTDNESELAAAEQIQLAPGTGIAIAVSGVSFCLLGNYEGQGTWYLYDSHYGLDRATFGSSGEAGQTCSISNAAFSVAVVPNPLPDGSSPIPTGPLTRADAQVQADLRNAALAEEAWLTHSGRYTDQLARLEAMSFRPSSGTVITLAIEPGFGSRYCLVASDGGQGDWWLYDGPVFGLHDARFGSVEDAEAACSITGATFPAPSAG